MYPASFEKLIKHFNKLPGVGQRTSERFVFHLLKFSDIDLAEFGASIMGLKKGIIECQSCFQFSEQQLCSICSNPKRDKSLLCIVATSREVLAIEQTSEYQGLYFVLGGNLDTIKGITPDRLRMTDLVARIQNPITIPSEIILGLNPHIEGETTALYLKKLLEPYNITTTKLARGLPTGSDLEYADVQTIAHAITGRKKA